MNAVDFCFCFRLTLFLEKLYFLKSQYFQPYIVCAVKLYVYKMNAIELDFNVATQLNV